MTPTSTLHLLIDDIYGQYTLSRDTCRVVCFPRMLLVSAPIRCKPKLSASPCRDSHTFDPAVP